MSENKKIFLKWWLSAALVYLIFAVIITYFYGSGFLMPTQDDTAQHINLAQNLIKYQTFGFDGRYSPDGSLYPTNYLVPGYALWLALIFLIFKSFAPAIFIGAIVFAFSVPLTYFIAKGLTNNSQIAFWSALIFMIEPLSIYHSGLLFTEQIFVPGFLLAFYLLLGYLKVGDKKFLALSFLIFSIATLIRSIIFYLLPILILVVIIKEFAVSWKKATLYGLMAFVLAYSLVGAWLLRNKIVLNTWQISSNQSVILGYHYEVLRNYIQKSRGLDPGQIDIKEPQDIYPVDEYNKIVGKMAIEKILENKIDYIKLHLIYTPLFFLSNGYNNLFANITGQSQLDKYFRNNLVSDLFSGNLKDALSIIKNAGAPTRIFIIGVIIWLVISILAVIGGIKFFCDLAGIQKFILILVCFLLFYFALVTVPLITARYRLPINPFIFILAIIGLYYIKDKIKLWI